MKKIVSTIIFIFFVQFIATAQTNRFSHPFSVSPSQTVLFSQGNINLDKQTNKMSFASNQVFCFRAANIQAVSSTSGVNDLFLGIPQEHQSKAFASLGDASWRTMTASEWDYLLSKRITRSGARYLKAYIANTLGIFISPDDFECPNNVRINVDNINNENPDVIQHFGAEWYSMEKVGVVFLPAAGCMPKSYPLQYLDENQGYYWIDDRTMFNFSENYQIINNPPSAYLYSYRLVKNSNALTLTSPLSDYHSWNNSFSTSKEMANVNQSNGAEGTYCFTDAAGRKIRVKLYKDRSDNYNPNHFTFAINGENIPCTGSWSTIGYGSDYYVHIRLHVSSVAVINSNGETKSLANMFLKGSFVYFNPTDAKNGNGLKFALYKIG